MSTPPKGARGGLTALNQVAITFGIFVTYFFDEGLKSAPGNWPLDVRLGCRAVPCLVWSGLGHHHGLRVPYVALVGPARPYRQSPLGPTATRDKDEVDEELRGIDGVVKTESDMGLRPFSDKVRPLLLI